jgi:ubiquinone/menaquinone biosynthesis C-methylase UbiE
MDNMRGPFPGFAGAADQPVFNCRLPTVMGVAAHLGIDLAQYDERIRTFIPDYEEMLDVAAEAVPPQARTIVDLGTGTGALAARAIEHAPRARVIGIDSDGAILAAAHGRLQDRGCFLCADFITAPLPECEVVVASFALHHVRTRPAKTALYRRVRNALRRGGVVITVDCHPATDPEVARQQMQAWRAHLENFYSRARSVSLLKAWSREDFYVPLEAEIALMRKAALRTEILWRKGAFAVILGKR